MSGFALKIKRKTGQAVLRTLTPTSTVIELKEELSEMGIDDVDDIQIRAGFPPKPLDLSNDFVTLQSLQINSGETLIIEEVPNPNEGNPTVDDSIGTGSLTRHHTAESHLSSRGVLSRQIVPSDNSCLFTSFGFVLSGKIDLTFGIHLRKQIASIVASDPSTYSEAILGKPNLDYCEWIQKSDSWGGAIELSVLASEYGLEITVVDTLNGILNRFGEDKNYPMRVLLIFDGIHYDALYVESKLPNGPIQTLFQSDDMEILEGAIELAKVEQSNRQYTDVNKFCLKCLVCHQLINGQVEAQNHAKETGHMRFGEVLS